MPNLHKLYALSLSPNRPIGQSLLKFRKEWQAIPMRLRGSNREFLDLCDEIVPRYSMVSLDRLYSLYMRSFDAARHGVEGAIVECGTWNGGAAAIMAAGSIRGGIIRDTWLYDSFQGMPL